MDKKIYYENLEDQEVKLLKKTFKKTEIIERESNKLAKERHDRIKKIMDQLEFNDTLECNKDLCFMLGIRTRTLNRYINELIKENKIKGSIKKFKNGGRGFVIESVISKKQTSKKEI